MYRILVIGAVSTTKHTLSQLVKYGFEIVGVMGHKPNNTSFVSGWVNLQEQTKDLNLNYKAFTRINDEENLMWASQLKPDIIFAVGFSQLLADEWLQMPSLGCIGFHPTKLPEGRGRAPLAWVILEKTVGSATFFLMGKGADDGPIFVQELFEIEDEDDASSVEKKIEVAIFKALDNWLPRLKQGLWEPMPQDESLATWYGKRSPQDGWINWNDSANYIDRLIKASTKPHPGAYTYFKEHKLIIWKSEIETHLKIKGVVGRILLQDEVKGSLVQCGNGLIWIKNVVLPSAQRLSIGDKLGYNLEDEIFKINKLLKELKNE